MLRAKTVRKNSMFHYICTGQFWYHLVILKTEFTLESSLMGSPFCLRKHAAATGKNKTKEFIDGKMDL